MKKFLKSHKAAFLVAVLAFIIMPMTSDTPRFRGNKEVLGTSSYAIHAWEDHTIKSAGQMESSEVQAVGVGCMTGTLFHSYFKFATPNLPPGAVLNSATLSLTKGEGTQDNTNNTVYMGRIDGDWRESTINWTNKPPVTQRGALNNFDIHGNWRFDVKNIVNDWLSGRSNYGISLYTPKTCSYLIVGGSSESPITPKLVITYTVAETPPDSPTSSGGSSGSTNTTTPSSTQTTTTPSVSTTVTAPANNVATVTEDTGIQAPTFMYAMINGEQADLVEGALEAETNDNVTVVGANVPGNKVVLFVGDKAYEGMVSSNGYFAITFAAKDIKTGEHKVEAQAQKDGKGSAKAEMFKLVRTDYLTDIKNLAEDSDAMTGADKVALGLIYVAPILFWVGLIVGIVLIVKKKRKTKNTKKEKEANKPVSDKNKK